MTACPAAPGLTSRPHGWQRLSEEPDEDESSPVLPSCGGSADAQPPSNGAPTASGSDGDAEPSPHTEAEGASTTRPESSASPPTTPRQPGEHRVHIHTPRMQSAEAASQPSRPWRRANSIQLMWKRAMAHVLRSRPAAGLPSAELTLRQLRIEGAASAVVFGYAGLTVAEWTAHDMGLLTPDWAVAFRLLDICFCVAMAAELVVKHAAFGSAYFRSLPQALDVAIVCSISLVSIAAFTSTFAVRIGLALARFGPLLRPFGALFPPDHVHFEAGVLVVVNVYALLMFVDLAWLSPPVAWTAIFGVLNSGFIVGFTFEVAIKLHTWGGEFLRDPVNLVDVLVVVVSLALIVSGWSGAFDPLVRQLGADFSGADVSSVKLLRLLRLARLLTSSRRKHGSADVFKLADLTLQMSCLSLLVCATAVVLITGNDALSKVLGGTVSILSLSYVPLCFFRRRWVRYPNQLLLWRCVAGLVTAVSITTFGVIEGLESAWEGESSSCPWIVLALNAPFLQFGFVAGEAWVFLLGWDVVQQFRNPLASIDNDGRYHVFGWGVALAWSLVVGYDIWAREIHPEVSVGSFFYSNVSACLEESGGSCLNSVPRVHQHEPTLSTINTLPISCFNHTPDLWWLILDVWWLPCFNLSSVALLLATAYHMNGNSRVALYGRRRAIKRSTAAIIFNLSYWLPLYLGVGYVALLYPQTSVNECRMQASECRYLGRWPYGDGIHNLLAAIHLLLSAQGFFSLLLFSAINRSGLYVRSSAQGRTKDLYTENLRDPTQNEALREEVLRTIRRGVLQTVKQTEAGIARGTRGEGSRASRSMLRARSLGQLQPPSNPLANLRRMFSADPQPDKPIEVMLLPDGKPWSDSDDEDASFAGKLGGEQLSSSGSSSWAAVTHSLLSAGSASDRSVLPPKAVRASHESGDSSQKRRSTIAGCSRSTGSDPRESVGIQLGADSLKGRRSTVHAGVRCGAADGSGGIGLPPRSKMGMRRNQGAPTMTRNRGALTSARGRLNTKLLTNCGQLFNPKVSIGVLQLLVMLGLGILRGQGMCTHQRECAMYVATDWCSTLEMVVVGLSVLLWPSIVFHSPRGPSSLCWEWMLALLHVSLFVGYVVVEHARYSPAIVPSAGEDCLSATSAEALLAFSATARLVSLVQDLLRLKWMGCNPRCALSIPTPAVPFAALAPDAFHRVRVATGMTSVPLDKSLFFRRGVGGLQGGRSGAFLFPSADGMIVVKTLKKDAFTNEVATLVRNAPTFASYFEQERNSLIARVLGVYSMRLYSQTIYFVVMGNTAAAARGRSATLKYDLKGSWINRHVKHGDQLPPGLTLKDMNIVNYGLMGTPSAPGTMLPLRLENAYRLQQLLQQLKRDTLMLRRGVRVMDYSLLVVVYDANVLPKDGELSEPERSSVIRDVGGVDLVVGIIDLPQEWTLKCRVARAFKTVQCALLRRDAHGISTIPVDPYQRRFMAFVSEQLFAGEELDQWQDVSFKHRSSGSHECASLE